MIQSYYYEATYQPYPDTFEQEGGIILAPNLKEATQQLFRLYEPELVSYKIEPIHPESMIFPLSLAQQVKSAIDTNIQIISHPLGLLPTTLFSIKNIV